MEFVLFLVVFTAVCIAFLQEIKGFFKKVFSVRWVQVLTPMLVVSFLWVWFDEEVLWALAFLKLILTFSTEHVTRLLPHKLTWITARVFNLYLPASVPAWLYYWKISRRPSSSKQEFRVAKLYAFLWLFFTLLVLS